MASLASVVARSLSSPLARRMAARTAKVPAGARGHGGSGSAGGDIAVHFVTKDGEKKTVMGSEGERILYLAHRHDIEMEGACEASLACTTCHCYVEPQDYFDRLEEATEEEEDLLDMAPFLQENSRLGCQILLSKELEGIVIRLPRATKNFYVDGHKPTPH